MVLSSELSQLTNFPENLQVMMFTIAFSNSNYEPYTFAIPTTAVLKVINCPPLNSIFQQGIGMVIVDQETITIADLAYKFFGHHDQESSVNHLQDYKFLIVLETNSPELCAIPVVNPPVLMNIPTETLRPLPPSYRQVHNINFVHYIAIVTSPQTQKPITVFLLGMGNS